MGEELFEDLQINFDGFFPVTGKGQIDGLKRIIHIGESIWGVVK